MPADLPALTRLTEDVVAAMHAAEQAQRRRGRWRREFPLAVLVVALLIPAALVLRGLFAGDDTASADQSHGHASVRAAQLCGVGAGTLATGAAVRAVWGQSGGRLVVTRTEACA